MARQEKKNNWDKNLKLLTIENKVKVFKINNQLNKIKKILKNNYKYIFFLGGQPSVIKSYSELEYETYISQIHPLQIILEKLRNQKKKILNYYLAHLVKCMVIKKIKNLMNLV